MRENMILCMNKKNLGVSILETLVYLAILASVLVFTVNTLISLNASFTGIMISNDMNLAAKTALERITGEVRKAERVDETASVLDVNPSVLALATTDDNENPTTILFSVENGALRVTSAGGDTRILTTGDIIVTNFTAHRIDTGRSNVVTILLELNGIRGKTTVSDTFHTAAVTRNQPR